VEELSEALDVPKDKVREAIRATEDAASLDAAIDESRPVSLPDPDAVSAQEQLEQREVQVRIERAIGTLDDRERRIVGLRYGIGHDRAHTLEQIGRRMGLSRERVRQLEVGAIKKLQKSEILTELLDNLGAS
jgi:RNA polymerase primary sigma factor